MSTLVVGRSSLVATRQHDCAASRGTGVRRTSTFILLTLALLATTADADERITDDTAYTQPSGAVRASLWKLEYAVHGVDGLELGTYTVPYVAWGFGIKSGNGFVEKQLLDRSGWTLSAGLGVTYLDLRGIDIDARITIVPVRVMVAKQLGDRFALGLGLMYSSINGVGGYNPDEDKEFRGAIAVSNAQAWFSLMWKMTASLSLYAESRGMSSTEAAGQGDLMYQVDDRTMLDVTLTGNASIEELQGSSTLLAVQYSREHLRIRAGIGYGNFNIPMINFIVPAAIPFPELDISWVF